MTAPVLWRCGACDEPLSLSNTLWKSPDGDYRCKVGGIPTHGGGEVIYVERVMHRPRSSWVHPSLREVSDAEQAPA